MVKAYVEERDFNLFADGSIDCLTLWPEKDSNPDDVVMVPFSEVLKERERCASIAEEISAIYLAKETAGLKAALEIASRIRAIF